MEAIESRHMRKFTLKHEINCPEERFWELFFDKEFNSKLFLEGLGFPAFETLELTESDDSIRRRVRGTPKMDVPGAVKKVLGDSFGYEEDGTWNRASKIWTWIMIPNKLQGKLSNKGKVTIEKVGDDKVRRIAEIEIEAKIFGVGGMIEKTSEQQMTDGWNKSAVFMNKWIADHPPA